MECGWQPLGPARPMHSFHRFPVRVRAGRAHQKPLILKQASLFKGLNWVCTTVLLFSSSSQLRNHIFSIVTSATTGCFFSLFHGFIELCRDFLDMVFRVFIRFFYRFTGFYLWVNYRQFLIVFLLYAENGCCFEATRNWGVLDI